MLAIAARQNLVATVGKGGDRWLPGSSWRSGLGSCAGAGLLVSPSRPLWPSRLAWVGLPLVPASTLGLLTYWFLGLARFPPLYILIGTKRDMQLPLIHGCLLCLALSVAGRIGLNVRIDSSGLWSAAGLELPLIQAASLASSLAKAGRCCSGPRFPPSLRC